jgi:outer membrane protein assembly factor BamB
MTTATWGHVELISDGGESDFAGEGEVDPELAAVARRYWALGQQRAPEDARERILRRVVAPARSQFPVAGMSFPSSLSVAAFVDAGSRSEQPAMDRGYSRPRWRTALELAAVVAILLPVFALLSREFGRGIRSPAPELGSLNAELAGESWPSFRGGPSNAGGFGLSVAYGPIPVLMASPEIEWHSPVGSARAAPAIAGALVFARSVSGELVALDERGEERWRAALPLAPPDGPGVSAPIGSPAVGGGIVYAGAGDGVHAFDAASGAPRWHAAIEPVASSPVVLEGLVVVAAEGAVYALDAATGEPAWRFEAGVRLSSPAVSDGLVLVAERSRDATGPASLYALDLLTGGERWRFRLAADEDFLWSPTVDGKTVYAWGRSSDRRTLYALDETDGAVSWRFDEIGGGSRDALDWDGSPAVVNDTVVTTYDGFGIDGATTAVLVGLDAATGAERWRVETRGWLSAAPVVIDGVVYVGGGSGDGGQLLAVDAETGRMLWQLAMAGPLGVGAAYANGTLVVSVPGGDVYAIRVAP